MLELVFHGLDKGICAFIGILAAYGLTCILLHCCGGLLPRDGGRDFAVDGKLSAGKERGAGIIFVCSFIIVALLFVPISLEYAFY